MSDSYFINLDRVPERAEFMAVQCRQAGIHRFTRVSAVDAAAFAGKSMSDRYAPRRWGEYWALKKTEIAVFESHRKVWAMIADTGKTAAVFEDDVLLSGSAGQAIAELGLRPDCFDLIKLDALGGQVRLHSEQRIANQCVRLITHDLPSAAAYMLSPDGAEKLLRWSERYCDHLDDFITRRRNGYRVFQLIPAVAVQGMFADVDADMPGLIAASERDGATAPVDVVERGPVSYRLFKEFRRAGRKLARRFWRDQMLLAQGGLIDEVALAPDLPGYRRS